MKSLSVFITIGFCFSFYLLQAQSWAPFHAGDTVNYQADTANHITHSIWVDSVDNSGDGDIYFFNRVAIPCDTCSNIWGPLLENQPQFFMTRMHVLADNVYSFRDTAAFTLLAAANLGEMWLWDTLQGVTAEVIEISLGTVFNQSDSLKTIALSSNDTIILSKEFGIIKFPEGVGNGLTVNSVGIENRSLGKRIPTFKDYYDFEVGDIFYHTHIKTPLQEIFTHYYQSTILEKNQSGDTLTYRVNRFGSFRYYNDPLTYIDTFEQSWQFINSPSHPTNAYPRELVSATTGCAEDYPDLFYYINYNGETKHWQNVYMYDSTNQDIYYQDIQFDIINAFEYYREGMGITHSNCYIFEAGIEEILTGHISGTDTFGVVTADTFLISAIEKPLLEEFIRIYPNPANNFLTIQAEKSTFLPATFQLRDLHGRIIHQVAIQQNEQKLSLPSIPEGYYIGEFITREGEMWRQKIVIAKN